MTERLQDDALVPEQAAPLDRAARGTSDGLAIGHAAVVLLFTRIASVALAWALEVMLVRMMTPAEWNGMSRFLTLAGAFAVAQFGFPESVLYFAARTESFRAGLKLTLRTSVLLAGLGALLGLSFVLAPRLAERALGEGAAPLMVPLMMFVTTDLAFAPLPSFLLARKHARLASALSFGTKIPIAVSVMVAIGMGLSLSTALHFMAAGSLLSLIAGWVAVLHVSRAKERRSAKAERTRDALPGPAEPSAEKGGYVSIGEQARFSVPVGLTRLVGIANVKLDKYIVLMVFSEAVFGSYYLGAVEFVVPALICNAVMTAMMADLVRATANPDRSEMLSMWHGSIQKIALVVLPIFVFIMTFADQIFVAIYGKAHESAAIQFRIFNLLILARVTNYTFVSLALNRPRVPFTAAGIALALNAGLCLIFVRTLGLIGPAVANVTAIYISTVYTLHAIRSALGVPWRRLFPLRRYLATLGVALLSGMPSLLVLWMKLPPVATLLVAASIQIPAFILLARAAGLLERGDLVFLKSVLALRSLRGAG